MIFQGNCTALVTPFSRNGEKINFKVLADLLDMQIDCNSSAVLILGTTGESATLTKEEKISVVKFAIKHVAGKIPVIVGAGSNNTKKAIENSKLFESIGADALLHVTPYYNKCTQKGLIEHFTKIADSVNIPIILYNIPSRTGVNILPETVKILSQHKNIVGIKEASGNLTQIGEIIRICPKDFAVYSGDDNLTLPILSLGGKGVISVFGNLAPFIMQELCHEYFNGNTIYACKIQHKISPIIKQLFCEVNPIPIKEALKMLGINVGSCRLPLCKMDAKNRKKLKQVLGVWKNYNSKFW